MLSSLSTTVTQDSFKKFIKKKELDEREREVPVYVVGMLYASDSCPPTDKGRSHWSGHPLRTTMILLSVMSHESGANKE
jgi:hypothetical protein